MLFEHEEETPQSLVYETLGDAVTTPDADEASIAGIARKRALWIGSGIMISTLLAFAILVAHSPDQSAVEPAEAAAIGHCDDELAAWMTTLIGAAAIGPDGEVVLEHPVGDDRFMQAGSGLYWQISAKGRADFTSRSLWDRSLEAEWGGEGREAMFITSREFDGEPLRKVAQIVRLPGSDTDWMLMVARRCG